MSQPMWYVSLNVVLDPRMKLEVYGKIGGFTEENKETWKNFCQSQYFEYRALANQNTSDSDQGGSTSGASMDEEGSEMEHDDPLFARLFRSMAESGGNVDRNELEEYLARPINHRIKYPLLWWKHQESLAVYPVLAKVARDYLAIPGMYNV